LASSASAVSGIELQEVALTEMAPMRVMATASTKTVAREQATTTTAPPCASVDVPDDPAGNSAMVMTLPSVVPSKAPGGGFREAVALIVKEAVSMRINDGHVVVNMLLTPTSVPTKRNVPACVGARRRLVAKLGKPVVETGRLEKGRERLDKAVLRLAKFVEAAAKSSRRTTGH
jgi:hypothetical protein